MNSLKHRSLDGTGPLDRDSNLYAKITVDASDNILKKDKFNLFTWLPWDFLRAAMCYRAIRLAKPKIRSDRAVPVENGRFNRVDVKATVRSLSSGQKDRIYVKDSCWKSPSSISFKDGWPVVWIFSTSHPSGEWVYLQEPLYQMALHAKNKKQLHTVSEELWENMVSSIGYGDPRDYAETCSDGTIISIQKLHSPEALFWRH
jgi:hypothetical protein